MPSSPPLGVGLIGCGNISRTYIANARLFPDLIRIVAVADIDPAAAAAAGAEHGVAVLSPDSLLSDPAVDLVLNLTVPAAHVPVALAAVEAGKHVYLEKPLGISTVEARTLLTAAADRGLRIGAAPDTFLGAAHQCAKRLIEEGAIGRVVGGSAAVMDRGMDEWHPNPEFFFRQGGGPVFDMGPYYLTGLVDLLGPARSVSATAGIGLPDRSVGSGPLKGRRIPVEVPTSVNALLRFDGDVDIVFSASWDVWSHTRSHIELYGTEGSIVLPDPNWFGGPVLVSRRGGAWTYVSDQGQEFGAPNRRLGDGSMVADYRCLGLADLAAGLRDGRPHRADGRAAYHVLEVMEAIAEAAETGTARPLSGWPERTG